MSDGTKLKVCTDATREFPLSKFSSCSGFASGLVKVWAALYAYSSRRMFLQAIHAFPVIQPKELQNKQLAV